MSIPQRLIEKAARSTYEKSPWLDGYEIVPWHHIPEGLRSAFIEDAGHALEAVAADIWTSGYNHGGADEILRNLGVITDDDRTPNPYRKETA